MNRFTFASIMPLLAAALVMTSCASQPPSTKTTASETQAGTRTGAVKNIMIKETVSPESLMVNAGDEVRWKDRGVPSGNDADGEVETDDCVY